MGSWQGGPSTWKDGFIPKIVCALTLTTHKMRPDSIVQTLDCLKIDTKASPVDQVSQGYADVFHKIHQTSDFKRDNVVRSIQNVKLPNNASLDQQKAFKMAQTALADAALALLTRWANSFIDELNEYSKFQKQAGAKSEDDSDNPMAAIAHLTPEDVTAVTRFLQYADAYSLQDAAEAANFE